MAGMEERGANVLTMGSRTHGRYASRLAERAVRALLARWREGRLTIHLPDGTQLASPVDAEPAVTLWVHRLRVVREFLTRGDIGIGESFVNGDWQVDDLPRFIELAVRNKDVSDGTLVSALLTWPERLRHAWRFNSRVGSQRNIREHYDLGNDLFALFLDSGLTYSSAVFAADDEALEPAQERKFARLTQHLDLTPADHVLEIGCGWGSFALHAARRFGCRVTALTISEQQLALARQRVNEAGLDHLIDVRLRDYRDVTGTFTKIVSIEMLEAVGRSYWARFFEVCHQALAPGGLVALQVIAVPDFRFEAYAARCDWIQKHIFPGGILPSLSELCSAMRQRTPFTVRHLDDIGLHYARTLERWRRAFLARRADVLALGYDERFIRTWEYYLASCEGAFRARALSNLQLILGRSL